MSSLASIDIGARRQVQQDNAPTEHLVLQRPLQRVLAFRRRSIDDVVNSPFVKNEIQWYWRVHKQVLRTSEIIDLERQWNALPQSRRR